MVQGNGLNGKASVFVNHGVKRGVNRMEQHFVLKAIAEHVELSLQHGAKLGRGIDVERSRAPQHAEGGNHAYQTETMVAVQMGKKNSHDAVEPHMRASQLHLGALATIYHKQFVAQLHHLRRGAVLGCGQGAATPKYVNSERLHGSLSEKS